MVFCSQIFKYSAFPTNYSSQDLLPLVSSQQVLRRPVLDILLCGCTPYIRHVCARKSTS